MKEETPTVEQFEPEPYCLRCEQLEWDEDNRSCVNFDGPRCPLFIRGVLAGFEYRCVVV